VGISGWLAFMAKPTSAAGLGIVVALYLALSGKLRVRLLALSVATAAILLLLSAWFIDGSVERFLLRLYDGAEDTQKLQGGYTLSAMLRWDDFNLTRNDRITLAGSTALVFLATCFGFSTGQTKRISASAFTLAVSVFCLGISAGCYAQKLPLTSNLGLQFLAVPLGAFLAAVTIMNKNLFGLVLCGSWALVTCFVIFPYVYVFGHNANYWGVAPGAAIFWVLAGVVLLGSLPGPKISWRMFLPVAAGAQLCAALLLFFSMENPYRQTQPLGQNKARIQFAGTGSTLLVSRGFAGYVDKLNQLAIVSGFKVGEPMLDLTGHYPGALYVLGAKAVGRAWMIGGYPGSANLASVALDRVPRQDLTRAWILTEPNGPRQLSLELLKRYGIDPAKDFIDVGTIDSPTGTYPESYKQHLLRPAK
jgi:hypothetical protein